MRGSQAKRTLSATTLPSASFTGPCGGFEPGGSVDMSKRIGSEVAAFRAEKRISGWNEEVGYFLWSEDMADASHGGGGGGFSPASGVLSESTRPFESYLTSLAPLATGVPEAERGRGVAVSSLLGSDLFCMPGVDGVLALTGVAGSFFSGFDILVGKPLNGGAPVRPNLRFASQALNLAGLILSLTTSDPSSAVSSRADSAAAERRDALLGGSARR